jgi:hypothetical protein
MKEARRCHYGSDGSHDGSKNSAILGARKQIGMQQVSCHYVSKKAGWRKHESFNYGCKMADMNETSCLKEAIRLP